MSQSCNHICDNSNLKQLCISKVPIFNHLPKEDLLEITKTSRSKTLQKGEILFQAGDSLDHLYIVHKGSVKIYRLTDTGKEQLIRIMEPGDFLGELTLFTNESLSNYAEALKNTEICTIHKSDIQKMLMTKPEISLKILEEFSKRLNEAEKVIERLSSQDAEKRVASYLVQLTEAASNGNFLQSPIEITLPMSKKDLASYMGMTQETLSRRLSAFQERGWISQTGRRTITILNYGTLSE